ncbi:MAG: phosphoribosylaminoimidazolesuccinocarboxamide synthase [Cytophagales bacterium]|nr:phosphoribosylaminoimidazolesuccinocarboxamide synthase [Cytophagales bacterium]
MENGIASTTFQFPGQTDKYTGKVREVYSFGKHVAMVATDRISAFDVVLPRPIPFKGQVLNQIAGHFLTNTKDIVPNWVLSIPDPNVTYGLKCEPFPVEMVIRGYLAGHAWREYKAGKRKICGVDMPQGMKENDRFPVPLITPTTKAHEGHDEDISREVILSQGLVNEELYFQLERYTRELFTRGTEEAQKKGLILVDTKYEFGLYDGQIYLIDEIHTPDSSRYFYADSYQELLDKNQPQRQLSKEFVREWLMEHGFQGKEGQTMPTMDDPFVNSVSARYIELFEKITGRKFEKAPQEDISTRIENNILKAIQEDL